MSFFHIFDSVEKSTKIKILTFLKENFQDTEKYITIKKAENTLEIKKDLEFLSRKIEKNKKDVFRKYKEWFFFLGEEDFLGTVAHFLARRGFFFDENDYEILSLKDENQNTVAHVMAEHGYKFNINNFKILTLRDKNETTVAHIMAENCYRFPENRFDILSLKDAFGKTVAYIMAERGYVFDLKKEILYLSGPNNRIVAHAMAERGYFFDENNFELLSQRDNFGTTVAHLMAQNGYLFPLERTDILFLKNITNFTVAHRMAYSGFFFPEDRFDILSQRTSDTGDTVAHFMAKRNYKFSIENINILRLENNFGDSVAQIMAERGHMFPLHRFDILFLCNNRFKTVLSKYPKLHYKGQKYPELENVSKIKIKNIIFKLKKITKEKDLESLTDEDLEIALKLFQKYGDIENFKLKFYESLEKTYFLKKHKEEIFNF